jgi:aspartyl-tRNA(Asn)/glutamyl-tRNA(Gln) amidotransferase subunit A
MDDAILTAAGLAVPDSVRPTVLSAMRDLREAAMRLAGTDGPLDPRLTGAQTTEAAASPSPQPSPAETDRSRRAIPQRHLHELSVAEVGLRLRAGTLTSAALTEHALARIAAADSDIHAFVTITAGRARDDAARADRELAAGQDRGPLHGIPYALKDMIDTAGIRTTAQSRLLQDNVPTADASVAARLATAGGVLLGKLATYEFALIGPSADLPFPPARNPRDLDRITGGSSSGCAAAVAAGFVRIAIGTDSGGSIRSPACYCGVVGLKPTYGRVSLHGVFPLSESLDHVGPLAATVADAAAALDAIADPDPAGPPRASAALGQSIAGLRIGYARGFHGSEATPEIADAFDAAAATLARLGAIVQEVQLPDYQLFEDCGAVILQAEALAAHWHWLRTRGGEYGRIAFQTLLSAASLSADDLAQARRVRRLLTDAVLRGAFSQCDALIVANVLATAPRFDAFDGITPHWTAMRTLPFNVTGQPALAVPIGTARDGLPMGMQIVGKPFDEAMICRIGAALEAAAWTS